MTTQKQMNNRVGLGILAGIGFIAQRTCGWQGVIVYGYGIVVGGVATIFMQDQEKTPLEDWLKRQVDEKKYLDIGPGAEKHMGVSREKLDYAVKFLENQGYHVHNIPVQQAGSENVTRIKIITVPEFPYPKESNV